MNFVVVLLLMIGQSYGVEPFIPQTKIIYVAEGDSYSVGIEEKRATKCAYKHNQGIREEFILTKNDSFISIPDTTVEPNFILDLGNIGLCQVKILNARTGGPTVWTIDALNETSILETVEFNVFIVVKSSLKFSPKSQDMHITEGGDFLVGYKRHPLITKCYFRTENATAFMDFTKHGDDLLHIETNLWVYRSYDECTAYGVKVQKGQFRFIEVTVGSDNYNMSTRTFYIHTFPKNATTFKPNVKAMYVTKNVEYKFGFEPYPGIRSCAVYYFWNTLQRMFFDVDSEKMLSRELNITHDKGACNIKIQTDTYSSESKWDIEASDGHNKISAHVVQFFYYDPVPIVSQEVILNKGNGFYQSLKHEGHFEKCIIQFEESIIEFSKSRRVEAINDMNNLADQLIVEEDHNRCAFKIKNLDVYNNLTEMSWALVGINGKTRLGNRFSVKIFNRETNSRISAELGNYYELRCGPKDQIYCKLFNPKRVEVFEGDRCVHEIKTVTKDDIGVWECYSNQQGTMESQLFTVTLEGIEENEMSGWTEINGNNIIIACKLKHQIPVDFCRLTSPSNKMYNLQKHILTSTSNALLTDLSIGYCSLETELPLPESEKGLWRCESLQNERRFGTTISVESSENTTFVNQSILKVYPKTSFLLEFEVPYSSKQCYVISPNGQIFTKNQLFNPHVGKCSFKVNSDYKDKEGTWSCFFIRDYLNHVNEQVLIEVGYETISPSYTSIQVEEGEPSNLLCIFGKPLHSCIFLTPNNQSFFIEQRQKTLKINYYGRGFEYGDCGIGIPKIEPSHFGNWTCISGLIAGEKHFAKIEIMRLTAPNISLSNTDGPDGPSLGTVLGGAAGVILVIILILGALLIYRKRK